MDNRKFPTKSTLYSLGSLRISGIYLLLGVLWILFSDKLAERIAPDPETLHFCFIGSFNDILRH